MKNNVIAVIVTFNPDLHLLVDQYKSVKSQVSNIIYVDNGSSNPKNLLNLFDNCDNLKFIFNDLNIGLGNAQNIGIKKAITIEATHILLLDQDSILDNNFIENLLTVEKSNIERNIKVGVIGPVFVNSITRKVKKHTDSSNWRIKNYDQIKQEVAVPWTIASGSLIRSSIFEEVGYLNGDYFIELIDLEWCFRARSMGYKVFVTPNSSMIHTIGDSTMNILGKKIGYYSPTRRYYLCRNSILLLRNNYGNKINALGVFIKTFIKVFISILKGPHRINFVKYSYLGYKDGLAGYTGVINPKLKL
jgi:rhamnosyltransferase